MTKLLVLSLQKISNYLSRHNRKSQRHKRWIKTVLKKLRGREQRLRQRLKMQKTNSVQHRAMQMDVDITNMHRRKALSLLKNIMQDLRSKT